MQERSKIIYLESLRGIAAVIVVLYHFEQHYFNGIDYPAGWSPYAQESPQLLLPAYVDFPVVRILFAGDFAVRMFFVLSGFVLSVKYCRTNDLAVLSRVAFRRFWRLWLPCAVTTLLGHLLCKVGAYWAIDSTIAMGGGGPFPLEYVAPLSVVLRWVTVEQLVVGRPSVNPVLWTIPVEYQGSILLLFVLMATHNARHRFWLLLAATLTMWLLMAARDLELSRLLSFWVGMLVALASVEPICKSTRWNQLPERSKARLQGVAAVCGFVLALYLASFPVAYRIGLDWNFYTPIFNSFAFLAVDSTVPDAVIPDTAYTIAAALFIVTIPRLSLILRLFESRVCVWLGQISFMLYLTHDMVMGAWAAPLFHLFLFKLEWSYGASVLTTIALYWPVALLVAWLLTITVERANFRFMDWIQNTVIEPETSRYLPVPVLTPVDEKTCMA